MQTNVQDVTLDPLNGGPGNNWTVHHGGQSGSTPSTYPEISLTKDSGPWMIHFKINNPGNNITFSSDPVWVQQNSNRPATPSTLRSSELQRRVMAKICSCSTRMIIRPARRCIT